LFVCLFVCLLIYLFRDQVRGTFETNPILVIAVFIVFEGLDLASASMFAVYQRGDLVLAAGAICYTIGNTTSAAFFVYHKWKFHRQVRGFVMPFSFAWSNAREK
jgi:hypothetical protein